MKHSTLTNRLTAALLTTCLITGNIGAFPLSAYAAEDAAAPLQVETSQGRDIDAEIADLLSAGEYEEGSAIVLYDKAAHTYDGEELVGASPLLANAEPITDVSAESYVEVTGDTLELPDEEVVGASAYPAGDGRIGMVLVEDGSKSTEELLRELLADPCVLTAEPNYIISVDDADDAALEAAAESALDTAQLEGASYVTEESPEATPEQDGQTTEESTENEIKSSESETTSPETPGEPSETAEEHVAADEAALAATLEQEDSQATEEALLPESANTAEENTVVGLSYDLTPYQWGMSDGSNRKTPHNIANEDIYGMNIPNWNTPGAQNAEGVIAVVDSGVDYTHPDLVNSMYRFSAAEQEALGCGEYGISVVHNVRDAKDPADVDGHGTHCAGVIAAAWDGVGTSGVASGVKILPVRALNDAGITTYGTILNGLTFVKKAKEYGIDVRVVSNSYSCPLFNYAIRVLVDELGGMGIVTVFASGNDDQHLDTAKQINDEVWDLPNVIIVNASNKYGEAATFTNFSQDATHVFAPGVDILSTIPESNGESSKRTYFAEMDPSPIYSDPAWNKLSDDMFADFELDDIPGQYWDYFSYSKVSDQSWDGTTPSLKIQIKKDIPEDTIFPICLKIPVSKDTKPSIASLAFYIPSKDSDGNTINKNCTAAFKVIGVNSDNEEITKREYVSNARIDWTTQSIAGLETLDLIEKDKDGTYYVSLYVEFVPKDGCQVVAGDCVYVDYPALASTSYNTSSTLYTYMDGTSMACPAVAGAAMIKYSGKSVNRESASQVAADVKASVRQKDSLAVFCTSGGVVDLSVQANQTIPVINTAALNDAEGTITLSGYYFGNLGSRCRVTLAGETLDIKSWEDNSIIVSCPRSMASGLQKISVTDAVGNTAFGAFSITVPKSSTIKDLATPLYEKTLADIPSDILSEAEIITGLEPLDDYIYVTVAIEQNGNHNSNRLIRYSIKDDSWENVDEIPFDGLFYCSMASNRGCIWLSGMEANETTHLVRYVPASGEWFETDNCGAAGSTLASYKDSLLYVGGFEPEYADKIRLIDPAAKDPLPVVGALPFYLATPVVTFLNDTLYIYGGSLYNKEKDVFDEDSFNLLCYTQKGEEFERDSAKEIDLSKYRAPSYEKLLGSVIASDKEVYLVGEYMEGDGSSEQRDPDGYPVADGDTWILGNTPQNYGKRLSHTITYNPLTVTYKGVLYGFGVNTLDGNPTAYVFRATTVDENPKVPIQDTVTVAIPKAVKGLVYNGKAQIGVPAATDGSYTIKNNKKTAAGTYKAVVKLTDPEYYVWEDGTRKDKTITWTITDPVVHVKSVKLNKTNLTLYTTQTSQLKATVSPSNAENKKVTWKSANTKIATVDSKGKVTAKAAGTVKVTVTTADGKKTATCTVKVIKSVPVYRLYNKKGNGEHLYTISASEKNSLVLRGWVYEGVAWRAPEKSSVPVYRFYNKNGGIHMYTSNVSEKNAIVKAGWKLEGIAFYAATTGTTKPIYRLYNPNGGQHFFTASAAERNNVKNAGWKYEGAAFQMVK